MESTVRDLISGTLDQWGTVMSALLTLASHIYRLETVKALANSPDAVSTLMYLTMQEPLIHFLRCKAMQVLGSLFFMMESQKSFAKAKAKCLQLTSQDVAFAKCTASWMLRYKGRFMAECASRVWLFGNLDTKDEKTQPPPDLVMQCMLQEGLTPDSEMRAQCQRLDIEAAQAANAGNAEMDTDASTANGDDRAEAPTQKGQAKATVVEATTTTTTTRSTHPSSPRPPLGSCTSFS